MKIGVSQMFGNSPHRGMPFVRDFAAAVEAAGFHSLWAPEHVVFFGSYQSKYPYKAGGTVPWSQGREPALFDPLFVVAAAAAATRTLRFGTTVLLLPLRPALLAAKEIMSLDHLTEGRFELGVGLGWSEEEYQALGVDWGGRGQRFDEYLDALKAAWTQDRAAFKGRFVSFEDVILKPFPLTVGGPPILIGGNSVPALRRAAQRGQGWYGVWMGFDDLEPLLEQLHGELERAGRSRDGFLVKLNLPIPPDYDVDTVLKKVAACRRLGVDEFVLEIPVRARSMERDVRHWADLLEVPGASHAS